MDSLDHVVDVLSAHQQRATYGAAAAVVGRPAAFLMAGRPRDWRHSWIVNQETLQPTGFGPQDVDPALLKSSSVLLDAQSLRLWLASRDEVGLQREDPATASPDAWWKSLSTRELLEGYTGVMNELRRRNVVRSSNNPVADLAEQVGRLAFGLELSPKSAKGIDGVCSDGLRWQIKGRRRTPHNGSTQLGAIRDLAAGHFDYVLAIYFDESFNVASAYRISHAAVSKHAKFKESLNGHVLRLTGALLADPDCVDVSAKAREAAISLHEELMTEGG